MQFQENLLIGERNKKKLSETNISDKLANFLEDKHIFLDKNAC